MLNLSPLLVGAALSAIAAVIAAPAVAPIRQRLRPAELSRRPRR